jgi:hypothetical protein
MASSSAPRRGRASVAVGSEAEVLPAGSATTHTSPFRVDSQASAGRRRVLAARIDQPDTHGEVVIVGGVLFVWFALLGVLGRCERCAGDGEAEREAAGADLARAGADGFVEDDCADRVVRTPG